MDEKKNNQLLVFEILGEYEKETLNSFPSVRKTAVEIVCVI